MRIGIYSGSFDPIHDGHVAFALEAIRLQKLDFVYFLVEPRPRHKQGVKAYQHRVAMVRLAVARHKQLGTLLVDQNRFSVLETWPVLRSRFAGVELFLLMGADVFRRLSHWPMVDQLITDVQFIVGLRSDNQLDLQAHLQVIAQTRGLSFKYSVFSTTGSRFNSTDIRRRLRTGQNCEGLHPAVARYIAQHGLYSAADSAT